MKKQENTYDMMKKLLTISRKGMIRQIVKEDTGENYNPKTQSRGVSPDEFETAKSEFAGAVKSSLIEFNEIKLGNGTVTWSGIFTDIKIQWSYQLGDDNPGVYISCESALINDSSLKTIQYLYGYYPKWAETWSSEVGVKGNEPEQEQGNQTPSNPAPGETNTTAQGPMA